MQLDHLNYSQLPMLAIALQRPIKVRETQVFVANPNRHLWNSATGARHAHPTTIDVLCGSEKATKSGGLPSPQGSDSPSLLLIGRFMTT